MLTPKQIIKCAYGHSSNFMTPLIHSYRCIVPGRVAAEVSYGESLDHESTIAGVSVAILNGDGTASRGLDRGYSQCFHGATYERAIDQALAHVESLIELLKEV
jgi:hypothetical protein